MCYIKKRNEPGISYGIRRARRKSNRIDCINWNVQTNYYYYWRELNLCINSVTSSKKVRFNWKWEKKTKRWIRSIISWHWFIPYYGPPPSPLSESKKMLRKDPMSKLFNNLQKYSFVIIITAYLLCSWK